MHRKEAGRSIVKATQRYLKIERITEGVARWRDAQADIYSLIHLQHTRSASKVDPALIKICSSYASLKNNVGLQNTNTFEYYKLQKLTLKS